MNTVLVVEDDIAIAQFLQEILEDEGYHVLYAGNGREALDLLASTRPSLVLTDIMMPIMDGLSLCHTMHHHAEYHSIPIILMSAVVQPLNQAESTYQRFVSKPLDLRVLCSTIESLIAEYSSSS